MKDIKKEVATFKTSCRFYPLSKREKRWMEDRYPELLEMEFEPGHIKLGGSEEFVKGDLELYQFIKEDVDYVEEIFQRIKDRCGQDAYDMLYESFVDLRLQEDVAERHNMSRRQFQYSMNKWLDKVFNDE